MILSSKIILVIFIYGYENRFAKDIGNFSVIEYNISRIIKKGGY